MHWDTVSAATVASSTYWFAATWIARAMVERTRPSSMVSRPAIVHPPGAVPVSAGLDNQSLTRNTVLELGRVQPGLQRHPSGSLHRCRASASPLGAASALTLRSELERLGTGQAHHDAAVSHSFQDEGNESRTRASEGRTCVKVLFVEEAAASARSEDGEDQSTREVVFDRRYDRHAFADLRGQRPNAGDDLPCRECWAWHERRCWQGTIHAAG